MRIVKEATETEISKHTKEKIKEISERILNEKDSYVVGTFDGLQAMTGDARKILTIITSMIHSLYKNGIPKELILDSINLAFEENTDDELESIVDTLKSIVDTLKSLKALDKKVKNKEDITEDDLDKIIDIASTIKKIMGDK